MYSSIKQLTDWLILFTDHTYCFQLPPALSLDPDDLSFTCSSGRTRCFPAGISVRLLRPQSASPSRTLQDMNVFQQCATETVCARCGLCSDIGLPEIWSRTAKWQGQHVGERWIQRARQSCRKMRGPPGNSPPLATMRKSRAYCDKNLSSDGFQNG